MTPSSKHFFFLLVVSSLITCFVSLWSHTSVVTLYQLKSFFQPVPIRKITERLTFIVPKKGKKGIHLNEFEIVLRRKWKLNTTNIGLLRKELATYRPELSDSSRVILHQQNVKPNKTFKLAFEKRNRTITPGIYSLLPKVNPLVVNETFRSCAVVGNSGSLLNSSCGASIDAQEFVFRCNLAPLSPFVKDAGRRSNFTTMNPSMITTRFQKLKTKTSKNMYNTVLSEYHGILWLPCSGHAIDLPGATKAMKNFKGKEPIMVCVFPDHFRAVVDFWREWNMKKKISTGFYLVTAAVQLCDEVHIYGFWPYASQFGNRSAPVAYHYFDNTTGQKADRVHSMDNEFNVLTQLHALGVLQLHVGTCS